MPARRPGRAAVTVWYSHGEGDRDSGWNCRAVSLGRDDLEFPAHARASAASGRATGATKARAPCVRLAGHGMAAAVTDGPSPGAAAAPGAGAECVAPWRYLATGTE